MLHAAMNKAKAKSMEALAVEGTKANDNGDTTKAGVETNGTEKVTKAGVETNGTVTKAGTKTNGNGKVANANDKVSQMIFLCSIAYLVTTLTIQVKTLAGTTSPLAKHSPVRPSVGGLTSPSKRSPVRPQGKIKSTDLTCEVIAIKLNGSLVILDVLKADGNSAYKADVHNAIRAGKDGTQVLGALAITSHKKEPTADSEMVKVGQKKIDDKIVLCFYENISEVLRLLDEYAKLYGKYTKPYPGSKIKPKARAGKVLNSDEAHFPDEHLSNRDIADAFVALYPNALEDGSIDDGELLGEYFSLTTAEDARDIIVDAFARMEK